MPILKLVILNNSNSQNLGEYFPPESLIIDSLNYQFNTHIQGVFFYWSPLNLAKSQSLYEIPYSNFFSRILLLVLGLSQI